MLNQHSTAAPTQHTGAQISSKTAPNALQRDELLDLSECLPFDAVLSLEEVKEIERISNLHGIQRRIVLRTLNQSSTDFLGRLEADTPILLTDATEYLGLYRDHLEGLLQMTDMALLRLAAIVQHCESSEQGGV
jgi:hypothetical protein